MRDEARGREVTSPVSVTKPPPSVHSSGKATPLCTANDSVWHSSSREAQERTQIKTDYAVRLHDGGSGTQKQPGSAKHHD